MVKATSAYVIASTPDERYKHPSRNKTSDEVIQAIDLYISSGQSVIVSLQWIIYQMYFIDDITKEIKKFNPRKDMQNTDIPVKVL